MIAFRDRTAREFGLELIVHINKEGVARGINPSTTRPPPTPSDEDAGAAPGARCACLRRGVRRRAARRGGLARQGARVLVPLARATAGTRAGSGRRCGGCSTAGSAPARRRASSRSPIGPRRTCGATSPASSSTWFRSISPAERPTIVRDGSLLVLDDDRMPLRPGETVAAAPRALPHARLLAADGGGRIRRRRSRQRDRGDAVGQRLRAPGAADRPRRGGRHGAQEAGGIFLMSALAEARNCRGASARRPVLPRRAPQPALSRAGARRQPQRAHLRLGRRRQVDADRPHAVGCVRPARRPARRRCEKRARTAAGTPDFSLLVDGLAAEREQGITIDIAWRYFDTPARAAGHHRQPRPRAVHAQHGDGRLARRCRHPAGRCAQRRQGRRRGGTRRSST